MIGDHFEKQADRFAPMRRELYQSRASSLSLARQYGVGDNFLRPAAAKSPRASAAPIFSTDLANRPGARSRSEMIRICK